MDDFGSQIHYQAPRLTIANATQIMFQLLSECRYSEYMFNFLRIKPYAALAAMLLLPAGTGGAAESVKYKVVSREVVESRLGRY
ncbi:MAG TPA: hypothetical protein VKV30_15970, partial [Candidatus Angelobacter sp.]|nr:hypothetical protein [Candidatus Angelobacter sp.]